MQGKSRANENASEFFVEVIAPDGLKHHVGPFQLRADAQDWIAQNWRRGERKRAGKKRAAVLSGLRSV